MTDTDAEALECTCGGDHFPVDIPTTEEVATEQQHEQIQEPPLTPTATIKLLQKQLKKQQEHVRVLTQQLESEHEKRKDYEQELHEQSETMLLSMDKRASVEVQRLQKRLQKIIAASSTKIEEQARQLHDLHDKNGRLVANTKQYLYQVQEKTLKSKNEYKERCQMLHDKCKEHGAANEQYKNKVQFLEQQLCKLEQKCEDKIAEAALHKSENVKLKQALHKMEKQLVNRQQEEKQAKSPTIMTLPPTPTIETNDNHTTMIATSALVASLATALYFKFVAQWNLIYANFNAL